MNDSVTTNGNCTIEILPDGSKCNTLVFSNGTTQARSYSMEGVCHRDPADGPAIEEFRPDGSLERRQYRVHDELHRDPADGPALERFRPDGTVWHQEFHVHGQRVMRRPGEAIAALSSEEHATVIAALRFYRAALKGTEQRDSIEVILGPKYGSDARISGDDIDRLCEQLNCRDPHSEQQVATSPRETPVVIVKINGGVAQGAVTNMDNGLDVMVLDYDVEADDRVFPGYPEPGESEPSHRDVAHGYYVPPLVDGGYARDLVKIQEQYEIALEAQESAERRKHAQTDTGGPRP